MNEKERLQKLISKSDILCNDCGDCGNTYCVEALADYLIANGVILPPCKVGDTVYYIAGKKIYKAKVHAMTLNPTLQIHLYDYDGDNARYSTKEIYTSKEEAEAKLKGGAQK